MKHHCAALFILLCIATSGQTQTYDSSYRFNYWEQQVSLFEAMPVRDNTIVWLGDSITDSGEWSELFPTYRTLNRGISADHTFGLLARLQEVTRRQPAKIFILIGINDISRNFPLPTIQSNYEKIVRQIKKESPSTIIYLQTLLPTNNDFKDYVNHQNKTDKVLALNEFIKKLAEAEHTKLIDLYTPFLDKEGKLNKLYTNDGLHLMGAGYERWKQVLLQAKALK